MVRGTLLTNGLPGNAVELEMIEGILICDDPSLHALLTELRTIDVSLTLDDFDTGHPPLLYLHRFPIDTLRTDRSFVQDLPHMVERTAIMQAIIMMTQAMGMKTVAESAGTLGRLEFLREVGYDELRDYLLTRPLEPTAIQDLVHENVHRYGERVPWFS